MYYLGLIQRFWNFNDKVHLGSTAIAMYLYLLKLGYDTNGYDVTISDVAVSNALGITRKTVKPTKEKLRDLGLLQYENTKGLPCSYKLLLNYPLEIQEPDKTPKVKTKSKPQTPAKEKTERLQPDGLSGQNIPQIPEQIDETLHNHTSKHLIAAINAPSLKEFIAYAQTLDSYETFLDSGIREKYTLWTNNGWRNNSGRPITNWKSSLKSTLPYMKSKSGKEALSIESIPSVKPPKSSSSK